MQWLCTLLDTLIYNLGVYLSVFISMKRLLCVCIYSYGAFYD